MKNDELVMSCQRSRIRPRYRKIAFEPNPELLCNHLYEIGNKNFHQSKCVLCSLQADEKKWEKERPVALLSIIGGSIDNLPTASIRSQLKSGLVEITKANNIWITTEVRTRSIEDIVKEVTLENYGEANCRVFQQGSFRTTKVHALHRNRNLWADDFHCGIEACILTHMDIPLIPIIIGGNSLSFEIAMSYLGETRPILLLDGSGGAADFIRKGYNLIMNGKREEKQEEDVFFQVKEAAEIFNKCWGCDYGRSLESYSELLARLMVKHLLNNQKLIHVYSVNEATYTLERTIEDIFFQLLGKGQQVGMRERDILHFVNIWNRPDIAETVVFNVENREILQTLRGDLADPDSSLAQLFRISLMRDRVDFVRLILEHIQIDRLYKNFLNTNLKTLYVETGCIAGFLIHKLDPDKDKKEEDKDKNNEKEDMGIVKLINKAVIQILGRREMQPFTPDPF